MASMRDEATRSYRDKMGRMGLAEGGGSGTKVSTASMGEDVGLGHVTSQRDGSMGMAQGGRAEGYATAEENEATMRSKKRLDRPAYKNGGAVKKGGTTVNVIVASPPQKPEAPPMPPPGAMPMPPPPAGPPPGAGGPPPLPGVPMGRRHGGRVPTKAPKMDFGAGGGKGRLEKARKYGDNAKC